MPTACIAITLALSVPAAHPDMWVQPVSADEAAGDLPEIPWLDAEPAPWHHSPIVHLQAGPDAPDATIWAAMSTRELYLHVVVQDAFHVNDQTGDAIWHDDAIQVAVDPRGDAGSGSFAATFALTRHGVRAWAHARAGPEGPGPMARGVRIERDAARKTTTYDIALPWLLLGCMPGESSTLGLHVQINDRDVMGTLRHAALGDSPIGTLNVKGFKTLATGAPQSAFMVLAPGRLHVWRAADAACAMLVSNEPGVLQAEMDFGDTRRTLTWQNTGSGLQRWKLCLAPKRLLEAPVAWSLIVRAQQSGAQARGSYIVKSPSVGVAADLAVIASLADAAVGALSRRHLDATYALLQTAWATALATVEDNEAAALQAAEAVAATRTRLPPSPQALERSLQHGERPLLAAFVSSEDQSLQPYTLTLPRVMDGNQSQPVLVFLHGEGSPNVAQFVAEAQASRAPPTEHTWVLAPWGRGNIGYRDFAETDVVQALEHADALFHFDTKRTWLAGFAMGGAGAWRVAVHRPDKWAAVAAFAGRAEGIPMGVGFGGNIAHLPVYLQHGLADASHPVEGTLTLQDELEKNGAKPEVVLEPCGGHTLGEQHRRELHAWLERQTALRPASVRYTSDRPGRSAFGITLRHDPKMATYPRMVVHIDGRILRLDTVGTTGLDIDLTEPTWGFTTDCRVMWNGTLMYEGPPKALHLGLGA